MRFSESIYWLSAVATAGGGLTAASGAAWGLLPLFLVGVAAIFLGAGMYAFVLLALATGYVTTMPETPLEDLPPEEAKKEWHRR